MLTGHDELLDEIETKRKMMIQAAYQKGFTNEETIRWSQELDVLILKYQYEHIRRSKNSIPLKLGNIAYSFV